MTLIFNPIHDPILIPASNPHPPKTQYRISIGKEKWSPTDEPLVIKVQMVYEGKIAGRTVPSYPLGTDDYYRVHLKIDQLITKYGDKR